MTLNSSPLSLGSLREVSIDTVGWVIFAASLATLGGAYIFQYGLGLRPCEMCLWQRPPYWTAMLMGLLAATAHQIRPLPRNFGRISIGIAAAVFFVGAGIAFYHAGVEQKWWEGPANCTGAGGLPDSFKDFQSSLEEAVVERCDEIPWSFLGLSLAGYNVLISLALGAISTLAVLYAKEPD